MFYDCDKCGATVIPEGTWLKAIQKGYRPKCESCRATRLVRVQYGDDYCVPHQGIFSPDDYPLDRSGARLFDSEALCGNRDCIKESHYATPKLVKYSQPRHIPKTKRKAVRKAYAPVQDTLAIFDAIALVESLGEASAVSRRMNADKKAGRIRRGQAA